MQSSKTTAAKPARAGRKWFGPTVASVVTAPDPQLESTPSNSSDRYNPTARDIFRRGKNAVFNYYTLAIVLVTVVGVVVAYQFRPTVRVDLGGGYDAPYLDGFGGEVRFNQTIDTEVTDSRDATQPAKLDPSIVTDGNGKPLPEPVREDYRWTKARSIVLLPGIGAYPAQLNLRAAASPLYPAGQRVQVLLNGVEASSFEVKPGAPINYSLAFAADRYQSGNMAVELRVTNLSKPSGNINFDPVKSDFYSGIKLYDLSIAPQSGGLTVPPIRVLITVTIACLMFFLMLAYAGLPRRYAFAAALVLTLAIGIILAIWRLELTVFTSRLMLLLLVTALALPVADLTIPRLFKHWGLPLPRWVWTGLLVLFIAGMFVRGGGVLYPQTAIIDQRYHIQEIAKVLDGPGFGYLYSSKDASVVPGHWTTKAVIPYSPFTYLYVAPIAALPIDRALTVNLFNVFLDAVRVLIIYALAVTLGASARAGLVGAGLYLLIPATYLLNSWGNWPTTISLWMGTLYLTLTLIYYQKLNRWRVWLSLTALLVLTMLAYTVTMVFMGMALYIWAAGLFLVAGRRDKEARQRGLLIFASATVAAIAAVAIYYYQFIGDTINTVANFESTLDSGSAIGLAPRGFVDYMLLYTDHVFISYCVGAFLTLALCVVGWAIFAPRSIQPDNALRSSKTLWLVAGWLGVFVVFGLVQWKLDMVDKQVWFAVPLIVALAGVAVTFIWDKLYLIVKGRPQMTLIAGRLAISTLGLWASYSAISLWIYRIFFKRH